MEQHPVITEFRQILGEKCPNFISMLVYFNWDEGPHANELIKIDEKFCRIEEQLNKTVWEDTLAHELLKQQLIELLPEMISIYNKLINELSNEELQSYKKHQEEYR